MLWETRSEMAVSALLIVGPTATGKTDLALGVAAEIPAEIVNADALQLVRRLDVGTGKPSPQERSRVPHHLFDVIGPGESFSAGEYARRARLTVEGIAHRDRLPLVVGGSGFYLQALTEGLAELPEPDPQIRRTLRREWDEGREEELWAELETVDPDAADRLEPRDRQRVTRALEIHRQTGRSMSRWLAENPPVPASFESRWLGLDLPPEAHHRRIATRVRHMVDRGWAEEVSDLLDAGHSPEAPGFQALGYREMAQVVRGEIDVEEAIESTVRATRRYAKRQRTWFRRWSRIEWLRADRPDEAIERALEVARRLLPGSASGDGPGSDLARDVPGSNAISSRHEP